MASSIAQPGDSSNGSNILQLADDNEADDFYMEDPARGNSPEALDSDNDAGPLNFNSVIDFPFEPDEIDLFCFFVIVGGDVNNRYTGLLQVMTNQRRDGDRQDAHQPLQNEVSMEDFKVSIRKYSPYVECR